MDACREPAAAHLVLACEGMPVSRGLHVFIPIAAKAYGLARVPGSHGGRARVGNAARLLPAEAAPQSLDVGHDLVALDAQHMGNECLVLVEALLAQEGSAGHVQVECIKHDVRTIRCSKSRGNTCRKGLTYSKKHAQVLASSGRRCRRSFAVA